MLMTVQSPTADAVLQCPHAARCPGCDHVGVPYAVQLAGKTRAVSAALAPYAELTDVATRPARGAAGITGYRTRAKWVAGPRGALGLFERGGHVVVDLPGCAIVSEVVARAGDAVRGLLRGGTYPAVAAALRGVDARAIVDELGATRCLLTIVLVRERRPGRRELQALARELVALEPRITSLWVNWAPAKAVQILGDETEHLAGATELFDRQGDVLVAATPGSFVQAHRDQATAMAATLVRGAKRLAPRGARLRVLELFAGAAPFGLALARAGCEVTSVESHAPAAEGVRRAALAQHVAIESLSEDAVRATLALASKGERFDLVVVDPPRRGLAPALRGALAALAPSAIAYVSCDPATLARDLAALRHLGFATAEVEPWDFIPQSAHVEALAWLSPAAPPPLRVLAKLERGVIVDAPPYLASITVSARAARDAGVPEGFAPTWPGASGALWVGHAAPQALAKVVVAVRGRPRPGAFAMGATLTLRATSGGRSLLEVEAPLGALPRLARALTRAGHPTLGDPEDGATARHLLEKFGVDRPLAHVEALRPEDGSTPQPAHVADIPGDMSAALARLGLRPLETVIRA